MYANTVQSWLTSYWGGIERIMWKNPNFPLLSFPLTMPSCKQIQYTLHKWWVLDVFTGDTHFGQLHLSLLGTQLSLKVHAWMIHSWDNVLLVHAMPVSWWMFSLPRYSQLPSPDYSPIQEEQVAEKWYQVKKWVGPIIKTGSSEASVTNLLWIFFPHSTGIQRWYWYLFHYKRTYPLLSEKGIWGNNVLAETSSQQFA